MGRKGYSHTSLKLSPDIDSSWRQGTLTEKAFSNLSRSPFINLYSVPCWKLLAYCYLLVAIIRDCSQSIKSFIFPTPVLSLHFHLSMKIILLLVNWSAQGSDLKTNTCVILQNYLLNSSDLTKQITAESASGTSPPPLPQKHTCVHKACSCVVHYFHILKLEEFMALGSGRVSSHPMPKHLKAI